MLDNVYIPETFFTTVISTFLQHVASLSLRRQVSLVFNIYFQTCVSLLVLLNRAILLLSLPYRSDGLPLGLDSSTVLVRSPSDHALPTTMSLRFLYNL